MAGLVASAMGDSAIYLLGATSDDGLNAKGAYLLQWTLIQWLKENGFKWYDLGGIDPEGNPGVYSFKKRIVRHRRVSINPACGLQQCCLFCGRQGKPGCATCSAQLGHSASWSCTQITRLRLVGATYPRTVARDSYLNTND